MVWYVYPPSQDIFVFLPLLSNPPNHETPTSLYPAVNEKDANAYNSNPLRRTPPRVSHFRFPCPVFHFPFRTRGGKKKKEEKKVKTKKARLGNPTKMISQNTSQQRYDSYKKERGGEAKMR
jgi:hypothetical protein